MAYCIPRYPAGFIRNRSNIQLVDYSDISLVDTDTTKLYDMEKVRLAAFLLNQYLFYVDLTGYPRLKARLRDNAYIDEAEMADIIFEIGYDPDILIDILLDGIPNEINIDDVRAAIDNVDKNISDSIKGDSGVSANEIVFEVINRALGEGTGDTPTNRDLQDGTDGVTGGTGIDTGAGDGDTGTGTGDGGTGTDGTGTGAGDGGTTGDGQVGEGGTGTGSNPDPVINTGRTPLDGPRNVNEFPIIDRSIPGSGIDDITDGWTPSGDVAGVLDRIEVAYSDYDTELDSNNCKFGASNPLPSLFNGLLSKYVELEPILGDLASLGNGASLSGLVHSYILGGIESAMANIVNKVEQVMQTAMGQVQNIYNSVEGFVKGNFGANALRRTLGVMMQKYDNLRLFFSKANGEMIKRKMREFAKVAEMQFEDLTLPLVISILLYRSCKFSSLLEALVDSVVSQFRDVANNVRSSFLKLTNLSGLKTQLAADLGGIRVPSKQRFDTSNSYAERVNRQSANAPAAPRGSAPPSRNVVRKDITSEEMEWVKNITKNGAPDGLFVFAPQVLGMGPEAVANGGDKTLNYQDAGWDMVVKKNPTVLILLRRVIQNMKASGTGVGVYTINSAYRSPTYNRMIGGAKNSYHSRAAALDVMQQGNVDARLNFIRFASEQGIGGIGYYNSFIHIDVGPRRRWSQAGGNSVQTTLRKHAAGDYFNGVNNIRVATVTPENVGPTGDTGGDTPSATPSPTTPNSGGLVI